MHPAARSILWKALRLKRRDGTKGVLKLREYIQAMLKNQGIVDDAGNLWLAFEGEGSSDTLFMAHLDTVHTHGPGVNQQIFYDDDAKRWVSTGGEDVLGADDGAGVAMLAHLYLSGVKGTYLFTQGEEIGGVGARWIKENAPDAIKGFKRSISFDRKGKTDICGEQLVGNCASTEFVAKLADALGMGHKWARGSFTDSAVFKGIIPEIVNISVGYENAHCYTERLDLEYLFALADKVITIDWDSMPVVGPAPDPVYEYKGYQGKKRNDKWDSYAPVDAYDYSKYGKGSVLPLASKTPDRIRVYDTVDLLDEISKSASAIMDSMGFKHTDFPMECFAIEDILIELCDKAINDAKSYKKGGRINGHVHSI